MADMETRVRTEIEALHVEFERWLRGESDSLARVEAALAADFTICHPRGGIVERSALLQGLAQARGTRRLRIRIENVGLRWSQGSAALATYEEWHEHDDYTTARLSTVLFEIDDAAPGGLRWRHVHETFRNPPPTWTIPGASST